MGICEQFALKNPAEFLIYGLMMESPGPGVIGGPGSTDFFVDRAASPYVPSGSSASQTRGTAILYQNGSKLKAWPETDTAVPLNFKTGKNGPFPPFIGFSPRADPEDKYFKARYFPSTPLEVQGAPFTFSYGAKVDCARGNISKISKFSPPDLGWAEVISRFTITEPTPPGKTRAEVHVIDIGYNLDDSDTNLTINTFNTDTIETNVPAFPLPGRTTTFTFPVSPFPASLSVPPFVESSISSNGDFLVAGSGQVFTRYNFSDTAEVYREETTNRGATACT